MNGYELGRIVRSKAGRDAGRHFVIVGHDGEFLLLADGHTRSAGKPKRKKRMHVLTRPECISSIQGKLEQSAELDHMIRSALRSAGYSIDIPGEG